MASDVNDITIQYEEDGLVIVKEIDKEILSKGSWATLLFRYRQWDKSKKEYGSDSYAIRTEAQRHNGTEAQRHNGTEAQRHKGTKAQRHRGTKAQRHRGIYALQGTKLYRL
jgi:hypothetical protein